MWFQVKNPGNKSDRVENKPVLSFHLYLFHCLLVGHLLCAVFCSLKIPIKHISLNSNKMDASTIEWLYIPCIKTLHNIKLN